MLFLLVLTDEFWCIKKMTKPYSGVGSLLAYMHIFLAVSAHLLEQKEVLQCYIHTDSYQELTYYKT